MVVIAGVRNDPVALCTCRRYEFMSEEGDIGFRVYYLEEDKKVDVVPSQRIDSHLMMESGAISCWRSNTCQFVSQFFSLLTRQQCPLRCRCRRIWQQFQLPALQDRLVLAESWRTGRVMADATENGASVKIQYQINQSTEFNQICSGRRTTDGLYDIQISFKYS